MKYTKGNITVSCNLEYMKRTSREDFISQQAHTGLSEADLGKYWDLVNGGAPKEALEKGLDNVIVVEFEPEVSPTPHADALIAKRPKEGNDRISKRTPKKNT